MANNSNLGSVKDTADALKQQTYADKIGLERWSPRTVDVYASPESDTFAVVPSESAGGTSTTCGTKSPACSGKSTPESGYIPYFYVTCGSTNYFGPDPYYFTPSYRGVFPGHAPDLTTPIRSYLCEGLASSERPTWKLMGFFTPSGCSSLASATYDETICLQSQTTGPTPSPTNVSLLAK